MDEVFDVMIIGAGAAGLTAGIYSSRAKHSTLILNEGAVEGEVSLEKVKIEHLPSGKISELAVDGVFAAGDCIPKKYRQVTTAVADGTIASLSASAYLRGN